MPTRRTLLLADDSPAIQKVVSLTFEDEGFRVIAVGSGGEALAHLEQDAPDIILADVYMPAPNGYELCARVKRDERLRHVPVLLLVGTFELFDEAEARRVGADGVLTKQPFQSIRDLVNKVGGMLGGHAEPKASDAGVEADARTESRADAWPSAPSPSPSAVEAPAEAPAHALPDFDLDDESIETVPADSYAAHAAAAAAEATAEEELEAFTIMREETLGEGAASSSAPSAFGEPAARSHAARQESHSFAAAASGFGAHASAAPPAPAAFEARTISSPAEDSLLDLDDIQAEPTADADDFILDFDEEPSSARHAAATFDPTPAVEAAPHVEAAPLSIESAQEVVEPAAHFEEPPAEISPANLSSAWQDFDRAEVATDADAATHADAAPRLGDERAATAFADEESAHPVEPSDFSAQVVEPLDFDAAPVAVEGVAPQQSDFEIVPPPAAEERDEAGHAEVEESASREPAAEPALFAAHESSQPAGVELSQATIDAIARRVVEQMSERVLREIAWEVVPDLAERLIRQRLEEERTRAE